MNKALSKEKIESVVRVTKSLFTRYKSLEIFLDTELEIKLSDIASEAETFGNVVHVLITHLHTRGTLGDFISAIRASQEYRGSPLINDLPADIILPDSKYVRQTLTDLTERLQPQVRSQIQKHARSKYIKGLYVDRRLESDLNLHHATEEVRSSHLRDSAYGCCDTVQAELLRLEIALKMISETCISIREKQDILYKFYSEAPKFSSIIQIICETSELHKNLVVAVLNTRRKVDEESQELRDCLRHRLLQAQIEGRQRASACCNTIATGLGVLETAFEAKTPNPFPSGEENFANGLQETEESEEHQRFVKTADLTRQIFTLLCELAGDVTERKRRQKVSPDVSAILNLELLSAIKGVVPHLAGSSTRKFAQVFKQQAKALNVFDKSCVVVVDRAGGGKTNLLCALASRIGEVEPTILLFGKEYRWTDENIVECIIEQTGSDWEKLNGVLLREGRYLHVFIDGINECRRLKDFEGKLQGLVDWAHGRRVRITMSCRDIYWTFFDVDTWEEQVSTVFRNELYAFSEQEYEMALDLYLRHFQLNCQLRENARETCRQPLLLRFFCEAYGGTDLLEPHNMGVVKDIRLKELFDEYFERKMQQVKHFLGHQNADEPTKFLFDLSQYMSAHSTSSILSYDVTTATCIKDTSSDNSVYTRLLDEDIIIEENPAESIDERRVSFVYEAFMEYIHARALTIAIKRDGQIALAKIAGDLKSQVKVWINAKGVAEYLALMLLGGRSHAEQRLGTVLLKNFVSEGGLWGELVWNVISKLPDMAVNARLFDVLALALEKQAKKRHTTVKSALATMARFSEDASRQLAGALLWSILFPHVLSWSCLERLSVMSDREFAELCERAKRAIGERRNTMLSVPAKIGSLIDWVTPRLPESVGKRIRYRIKLRGKPATVQDLLRDVWGQYPAQHAYILNGLFVADTEIVLYCVIKLKEVRRSHQRIGQLLSELANVEPVHQIAVRMVESAKALLDDDEEDESVLR